jgi:CDP-diacylglycerol--glycerol-3-phosphate 3-phosphatidyltransferase
MIFQIPNLLSLSRIPLSFIFALTPSLSLRITTLFLAALTDVLDGFIARRKNVTSKLGAILDPICDKFFVFMAIFIFFLEKKLNVLEISALLSRDLALIVFAFLLFFHKGCEIKANIWGKISTFLQFFILASLTFNSPLPSPIYFLFFPLALLFLLSLYKNNLCRHTT